MKNLYILLITLFAFTISQAQIVNIPDVNFKNALVNTDCVDTNGDNIGDANADVNNDGEIQVAEALLIDNLHLEFNDISTLEGIASFVNIEYLECRNNEITSLDLSQNVNLVELECYQNLLTEINLSQNYNLTSLNCKENLLTNLDITNNINLEYLDCDSNQIASLDVSQNTNLIELTCSENQLTNLDLSQNINLTKLISWNNLVTDINVLNNNDLRILEIAHNQLEDLDVTQNLNLEFLSCSFNQLTDIDVTQNTNLEIFYCWFNQFTSLDVSQNINLGRLYCDDNQLTFLDVSQNENLFFLWCYNNQLSGLNVNNNNNGMLNVLKAQNNPDLFCIQVDDVDYANNASGWTKDVQAIYSEDCVLGVEDNNLISFNIHPNPAQDVLNIESQQQIETVKIYNLQGQLIEEESSNSIDVSEFTSGLYFVQVSINGINETKKLIKE